MPAHIRRGDQVIVTAGSHKGKRGKVLEVKDNRVTIEKVAMVKRHTKANQANPQGGIVDKEGTIHISNVLCSTTSSRAARARSSWSRTARRSASV